MMNNGIKSFYKISFFGGIVCLLTSLISCNDKIDLIGDFQETAVVYGLLDQSDSIHYVRINRAFIGPGNSLEFANIPDSNYFDLVDATITETVNGNQTREWILKDTLVENKDTNGVFYAPEQKLYYFVTRKCNADGSQALHSSSQSDLLNSLNENARYKIHISVNGGQFEVDGETDLVKDITSPTVDPVSYRFDYIENDGSYASNSIKANVGNSYIINTALEVAFQEFGSSTNLKKFKWTLGEGDVVPNGFKVFTMPGENFYNLIKENCTADPSIFKRRIYSIKAIVTGGSEDLYNYIAVSQPNSSIAQNKPTYTNLTVSEGARVVGIFSSRYTYSVEKLYINPFNNSLRMLTVESVIELCQGPITGDLNFCSNHPADNGTNYYCN
jgi:hypothetical protein